MRRCQGGFENDGVTIWQSGLEGKGVLVTGAAGGIGRAVAVAFAAAGAGCAWST